MGGQSSIVASLFTKTLNPTTICLAYMHRVYKETWTKDLPAWPMVIGCVYQGRLYSTVNYYDCIFCSSKDYGYVLTKENILVACLVHISSDLRASIRC